MQHGHLFSLAKKKLSEKKGVMYVEFTVKLVLIALLGVVVLALIIGLVSTQFERMNVEVVNRIEEAIQ